MYIKKLVGLFIGYVFIALLVSCASVQVSRIVLLPAKEDAMVDAQRIAISDVIVKSELGGYRNFAATERLETFISRVEVAGEPRFKLVERGRLAAVLQEQGLSEDGLTDSSTAARVGKLVGADTIILAKLDIKGPLQEDSRGEINCRAYTYDMDFYPKSVRIDTAAAFSKAYNAYHKVSKCDGQATVVSKHSSLYSKPSIVGAFAASLAKYVSVESSLLPNSSASDLEADHDGVFDTLFAHILKQYRRDIAPYKAVISFTMMDADKGKKDLPASSMEELRNALNLVEHGGTGGFGRACNVIDQLLAKHNNAVVLLFNSGVCAEVVGDLGKSLALYQKAEELISISEIKQLNFVHRSIERVKAMRASKEKLRENRGT